MIVYYTVIAKLTNTVSIDTKHFST